LSSGAKRTVNFAILNVMFRINQPDFFAYLIKRINKQ
jgi:hypothetical protein